QDGENALSLAWERRATAKSLEGLLAGFLRKGCEPARRTIAQRRKAEQEAKAQAQRQRIADLDAAWRGRIARLTPDERRDLAARLHHAGGRHASVYVRAD